MKLKFQMNEEGKGFILHHETSYLQKQLHLSELCVVYEIWYTSVHHKQLGFSVRMIFRTTKAHYAVVYGGSSFHCLNLVKMNCYPKDWSFIKGKKVKQALDMPGVKHGMKYDFCSTGQEGEG